MNRVEFDEWLDDFCACFPAARSLFEKAGDRVAGLQAHWWEVLAEYDAADMAEVTKRMFSGEDPTPGKFDWHTAPRHMATLCRRRVRSRSAVAQVRFIDGERVYQCLRCLDVGFLRVWSQISMRKAAAGELREHGPGLYDAAVACDCDLGRSNAAICRWQSFPNLRVPVYDPRRDCLCLGFEAADIAALETFMLAHGDPGVA